MATQQEIKDTLLKVDAATTKTAATVQAVADNLKVVSDTATNIDQDIDKLIAALQGAGVPQEILDQANALAAKTEALDAATTAVAGSLAPTVEFLKAIALKGDAVIPPPPPPPPPVNG